MAWNAATKQRIIGDRDPLPGFNYSGASSTPIDLANWPVRSPGHTDAVAEDGPRLVNDYLRSGWANPMVIDGLDQLEAELRSRLAVREALQAISLLAPGTPPTHANYVAAMQPGAMVAGQRPLINGLLREVLLEGVESAGLLTNAAAPPLKVPLGILSSDDFYGPIEAGQHFKDVLVGLEHGEWTHLMQWYLLTKNPPSPTFDAKRVYRYLGRQGLDHAAMVTVNPHRKHEIDLWGACCDRRSSFTPFRGTLARNTADLRCPDNLHVGLVGLYPATGSWLSRRDQYLGTSYMQGATAGIRGAWHGWDDDWSRGRPEWSAAWQGVSRRDRWALLSALLHRRLLKRRVLLIHATLARREAVKVTEQTLRAYLNDPAQAGLAAKIDFANTDFKKVIGGRVVVIANVERNEPDLTQIRLLPFETLMPDERTAIEAVIRGGSDPSQAANWQMIESKLTTQASMYVLSKHRKAAPGDLDLNLWKEWQDPTRWSVAKKITLVNDSQQPFIPVTP